MSISYSNKKATAKGSVLNIPPHPARKTRRSLTAHVVTPITQPRWSESVAKKWYARQPWLCGCNYIPATAINQLEMWQADTFDPSRIDTELELASSIGMNTVRVFLHDLLWDQDAAGFIERIDIFLQIADKHGIRPMFVLFDSCWDPFPQLGVQRVPQPGVHNSGWVQSPGARVLKDAAQQPRLESYVRGVVGAFARDERILAWDVWNEPDNMNTASYGQHELADKVALVLELLPKAFQWARAARPTQPLTSAIWNGNWCSPDHLSPMERVQVELSDVISFHSYDLPDEFECRLKYLQRYNRPLLCTEYMARGNKSTFEEILPIALHEVAVYNWGLVVGKSQTHVPWDSWDKPYTDRELTIWFHDIFHTDGTPYRPEEIDFIRELTDRRPLRKTA
jgi:hypothetical protein